MEKVKIEIYLEGGIIQDITGPDGTPLQDFVQITKYDYDIEGEDIERIGKDRNGQDCIITEY